MAVPSIVQQDDAQAVNVTSVSINFTAADPDNSAITAGSAIAVCRGGQSSATRDITMSDDVDGTYTVGAKSSTNTRGAGTFYQLNHTGGDTVVTASTSFNASYYFQVFEVSGADTFDAADANQDLTDKTSHVASTTGINTAADCIVFLATGINSTGDFDLTTGGFTETFEVSGQCAFGWKTSASAITGEQGAYTTSVSRDTFASVMSLSSSGGGGGGATIPIFAHHYRQMH